MGFIMIYCVSLENMIEPAPRIIQVNIVVPNCIAASIYVDSTTLSLAYATSFEQSYSTFPSRHYRGVYMISFISFGLNSQSGF